MSTDQSNPPPKGAARFAAIAAVIVAFMIVAIFVGMNVQHAKTLREEQAGQIKPQDKPMHEKDLSKSPPDRR